ncbi:MAG: nucleotidyltransferase [Pseudonocardiales bacterium]|nr:nucleotidyltransferase family protein [Actinomycetota bacterium]PZS21078.1 MAG: nucleotidyltransferase [Pseudonocardiales bacterium]
MALRRWSDVDVELLDELCRRYGISELLVFGSAARGEDTPDSDLDLLYELRPGARLGWEIEQLSEDLAELFGRPVDLISRRAINPHLGAAILRDARPLYAA